MIFFSIAKTIHIGRKSLSIFVSFIFPRDFFLASFLKTHLLRSYIKSYFSNDNFLANGTGISVWPSLDKCVGTHFHSHYTNIRF